MTTEQTFLETLNTKYLKLHKKYESLFWDSYMGDNSLVEKRNVAQAAVDNFRSDEKLREKTAGLKNSTSNQAIKERLQTWVDYFDQYQTPQEAKELKLKIDALESKIGANIAKRKEGYIHPKTKKYVTASILKMRTMIRTHEDEAIRKACYEACEKLGVQNIDDYVKLVILRNEFAQLMGYSDFYDYTLKNVDKMTKEELFGLFGEIEKSSSSHFTKLRELAKKKKGLRKPWNFAYVMTGDFTKEEDPYFSFDQAVSRWGRSFSELGIPELSFITRYRNNG
jgi:Zn-dependent oligopeptidase